MAARRAKAREADPPTQVRQLEAALERDGLARGYVLRGEERYFRERALDSIKRRAQADNLEVHFHDGDDPDFALSRLLDDLSGGGLFAARQLIVARNVEKSLKKVGKDAGPLTRAITAFIGGEDAGTVVVSVASLRADHGLVKAIAAAGGPVVSSRRLWDSPPPWGDPDPRRAEIVVWLVDRAREMEVKLSPAQAVYVCAATGNDPFALQDQLEKLRDAPAGSELERVVGWEASTSPWAVAEALVAGDLPRALNGVETLFRGGFAERDGRRMVDPVGLAMILIGSLAGSVRKGLAISTEMQAGSSPQDAARAAGVAGAPNTVQAQIAIANKRTPAVWRRMLEEVGELERKTRTSAGIEPDDLVLLAVRWRANARKRVTSSR